MSFDYKLWFMAESVGLEKQQLVIFYVAFPLWIAVFLSLL